MLTRPRSLSFDCNMKYSVLLIVVVGLVIKTRCNPYREDRMTEEAPPGNVERGHQCIEDDQVCQGLVKRFNELKFSADSWFGLSYCFNYGPQSGIHNNWAHETDPNKTWQKLCPVTCKICATTPNNPEPCSDRHPGCTDFVENMDVISYGGATYVASYCDMYGLDGMYHTWCPKTCGSCQFSECSDKLPVCAQIAVSAELSTMLCDFTGVNGYYHTWCPKTCGSCLFAGDILP